MNKVKLPRGEDVASAKLTRSQANALREDYRSGSYSQRALAKKYGVCQSMVCYILKNRYWR